MNANGGWTPALTLGLLWISQGCGKAEDVQGPDQVKGILEKALKAHGGKEGLLRLRTARVTYDLQGQYADLPALKDVALGIIETYQLPRRMKKEIRGTVDGRNLELAWVAYPDRHWFWERGNETRVIQKRTDLESEYRPLMLLEALADDDLSKWALADEETKAKEGVIALRWQRNEESSGSIVYFSRETGMLTGSKTRQFIRLIDREAWIEARLGEYRSVGGSQIYHQMVGYQDGAKTSEITIKEVVFLGEIEDRTFAPPQD